MAFDPEERPDVGNPRRDVPKDSGGHKSVEADASHCERNSGAQLLTVCHKTVYSYQTCSRKACVVAAPHARRTSPF